MVLDELPNNLRILRKYSKNLKIKWRQNLMPSLLSRKKWLLWSKITPKQISKFSDPAQFCVNSFHCLKYFFRDCSSYQKCCHHARPNKQTFQLISSVAQIYMKRYLLRSYLEQILKIFKFFDPLGVFSLDNGF